MGIESEKKHNKLVKKVLTRIKINNLYIKYKWKVREVGVVIWLDRIKMEKVKVKAVLDCVRIINNRLGFTLFYFIL